MRSLLLLPLLCLVACGFGAPTLDFDQLNGNLSETDAQALQSRLDWQCSNDDPGNGGRLGQRVCDAPATTLNGIPATRIDYLFRDGKLAFAIIEFSSDTFPALAKAMDAKHSKRPSDGSLGTSTGGMLAPDVTAWTVKDGVVASSATQKKPNGNVFLLWISSKQLPRNNAG